MKTRIKKSVLFLSVLIFMLSCISCSDGSKYDGLVLTDEETGKKYLLKHNSGDTYFVDEEWMQITKNDTIRKFK